MQDVRPIIRPIESLKKTAQSRPANYMERVLSLGVVVGNEVHFSKENYLQLVKEFSPHRTREAERITGKRRLGDWVELFALPIAKLLDRLFGARLKGCSACQRRKRWLNRLS